MPKLQRRNTVRYDTRNRPIGGPADNTTEVRAICGCGYPTSWVEADRNAIALHALHQVVHRAPPV